MRRSLVGMIVIVEFLPDGPVGVVQQSAEALRRLENATSVRGEV
jgi:hypothetical protein